MQIFDERPDMTFQVAMVGKDGLVIVSDRREIYWQRAIDNSPASIQPTNADKIMVGKYGLFAAFAGSTHAHELARSILSSCCDFEIDAVLNAARKVASNYSSTMDEVLVASSRDPTRIIALTQDKQNLPTATYVTEYRCAGTFAPARFIPLHFWSANLLVSALEQIALTTIYFASQEDRNGIGGGANLLVIKSSGPSLTFWPEDKIEKRTQSIRAAFMHCVHLGEE